MASATLSRSAVEKVKSIVGESQSFLTNDEIRRMKVRLRLRHAAGVASERGESRERGPPRLVLLGLPTTAAWARRQAQRPMLAPSPAAPLFC